MVFLELKEFTKSRIKATETVELSEQNSPPLPSLSVFCETKMGGGECHTPSQDPLPLIIPHFTRDCKLQGKSCEITKVNWISKTVPIMTWYRFCRTVSRLFFLQKMDFDLSAVQSVSLKSILRYRIILGSFLSASRTTNIWKQTEIREMHKGVRFWRNCGAVSLEGISR